MNQNPSRELRKTRIILAHRITLIRQALKDIVRQEQDMEVIAETDNGKEAVTIVSKLYPDLILIDEDLPGLNGMEATKRIVRISSCTKVLVLTYNESEAFKRNIQNAGAGGSLSIYSNCSEILHAIRNTYSNEGTARPTIVMEPVEIDLEGKSFPIARIRITARELMILKLVAKGTTNKEISQKLGLSLHYVKACLTNIFTKLGVSSRTEAASFALTIGLLERSDFDRYNNTNVAFL